MTDISTNKSPYYVDVILPLAINNQLTYLIPDGIVSDVSFGKRVEVPLRNKLYSALVIDVHQNAPEYRVKTVISVLDPEQIISDEQYQLWTWMAEYYCCTLGEVMSVALPSGLKLSSETRLIFNEHTELDNHDLTDDEFLVGEALSIQHELTIDLIKDILNKKTVYPVIRSLLDKQVLFIKEELIDKYVPKKIDVVILEDEFATPEGKIEGLNAVRRSEKQTRAFLAILDIRRQNKVIPKDKIKEVAEVDTAAITALYKKGLVRVEKREISRLIEEKNSNNERDVVLSDDQQKVVDEVSDNPLDSSIHLIHGVTGSGKTSIYITLIRNIVEEGGQVLYLMPEIALTSQMIERLEAVFDRDLLAYHSKINNHERVEIWKEVIYNRKLIIGARSSVFLPFHNLKLIIVDEEHDPSFKQDNPNPRYNARDTAVYLAKIYGAKVVLGSATPSLESFHNVQLKKYGYCYLPKRYGNIHLPAMELVDIKRSYETAAMKGSFSLKLKDAIEDALEAKEQVILFQNRRGYAPIIKCTICAWTAECPNCDVSLTFHQRFNELKCHYCGYRTAKHSSCPSCGNQDLKLLGLGTQRIEEEIRDIFPDAQVKRFDYDTANTRKKHQEMIYEFENGQIDILVGTQMISKGFDFENISLVGVLNADTLLGYPDFRAEERTFQLLTQVSGRAGRRSKQGKVVIQTFNPVHPVLQDIIGYDIQRFYARELKTRSRYVYPPYYRLINVWFRHKKLDVVKDGAMLMYDHLSKKYGKRIGPSHDPPLLRVRGYYQQLIIIKLEKNASVLKQIKEELVYAREKIRTLKPYRSMRIAIDVDPY